MDVTIGNPVPNARYQKVSLTPPSHQPPTLTFVYPMGTRLVRLHLFACRISACLECETRKSLRTSQAMRVPSRKCNKNATWQPDSSVPDIRHAGVNTSGGGLSAIRSSLI